MKRYLNNSGNSNVKGYILSTDSIVVSFNNSSFIYTYNSQKPGLSFLKEMQRLAEAGKGLGGFIKTTVNKNYYSKTKQHFK
jgi:hypothetical protein